MANNNDIDNNDFESDFDQNSGFDEFGSSSASASVGSTISGSPVLKLALVGVAVLVVVAAIALFGGDNKSVSVSRVDDGATELKEAPGTSEVTQTMRGAIEEHNQQSLEAALKEGASSIPTPIDPPKVLLEVPDNEAGGEDPLVRWKRLQEERLRLQREQEQFVSQAQVDPQQAERVNGLAQAMIAQVGNIMGEKSFEPMQNMKVYDSSMLQQSAQLSGQGADAFGGLQQSGVGGEQGVVGQELLPLKVLIPAGDIAYGQLLMEANSDIPGPIVALLVSGPFSGSRVLGSFQRQEEYLIMEFNTLVGKDGHSIPINAVAVDPDTTLTGMATDVDHRYLQRIVLPAAVSFIQGMGSAIAENGTTTVEVSGGDSTVSQENSDLDTKQELSKAVSEAADKVGEILDEDSDVEILVRVKAGTPLGLMFTTAVTDQDVHTSQYASNPNNPNNPNNLNNQQNVGFFGQGGNPMQLLQQGLNGQVMMQQPGVYFQPNGVNNSYNNPYNNPAQ
ncbi:MAG: hypothetical protein H6864_07875 [Micavibrio sp.]|nr:hypothetical protein [Micavibrio sp.]